MRLRETGQRVCRRGLWIDGGLESDSVWAFCGHTSMTRHIYRAMENYDHLDDEWINQQSQSDIVRQLLRRDGYIDKNKMDWAKEKDYLSTALETIEKIKS